MLHWLFLGKELSNGLRVLTDDKAYLYMSDNITDGGVAHIVVEHAVKGTNEAVGDADYDQAKEIWKVLGKEDCDDGVEFIGCKKVSTIESSTKDYERDLASVRKFYGCTNVASSYEGKATCSKKLVLSGQRKGADSSSTMVQLVDSDDGCSDDSDFLPGDDSSSEDDEEAQGIMKKIQRVQEKVQGGSNSTSG